MKKPNKPVRSAKRRRKATKRDALKWSAERGAALDARASAMNRLQAASRKRAKNDPQRPIALAREGKPPRDDASRLIEKAEAILRFEMASGSANAAPLVLVLNMIRRVRRWPVVSDEERTTRGWTDRDISAFLADMKRAARRLEQKDKLLGNPLPDGSTKNARLDHALLQVARIRKEDGIEAAGLYALRFLPWAAPTQVPAIASSGDAGEVAFLKRLAKKDQSSDLDDEQVLIRAARHLGMRRPDNLFARAFLKHQA